MVSITSLVHETIRKIKTPNIDIKYLLVHYTDRHGTLLFFVSVRLIDGTCTQRGIHSK